MTRIGLVAYRALALTAAVALTAVLAGGAAPARAASVGFYGTYGGGEATGDDGGAWGESGRWGWDRDTTHTGAGLALETPTGLYRLSYRLGIGWERITSDGANGRGGGSLEGLVLDNDFTYDLFAGPQSRFWIGPEFRLGFLHGSLDNAPGGDKSYIAAGIGPVVGFDLALGPSAALSWKLGYLYTWYYSDEGSWDGNYYRHGDYYYDESEVEEGHAYVSLALLFRLWGGPQAGAQPGSYQPEGRW